jgi:AbrB family transcriptional regulator (stage V sporulation protein T)
MKATGIVRRLDDLGRVIIPKEIRKTLRLKDGDPMEIFVEDGGVYFKKYSPLKVLNEFTQSYADSLYQTTNHICMITDRDNIIAVSGISKRDYIGKSISERIEYIMNERTIFQTDTEIINIINNNQPNNFKSIIINSIISDGDILGTVILASTDVTLNEIDSALVKNASIFLGKQMEE